MDLVQGFLLPSQWCCLELLYHRGVPGESASAFLSPRVFEAEVGLGEAKPPQVGVDRSTEL
jgi:hypothetical protein